MLSSVSELAVAAKNRQISNKKLKQTQKNIHEHLSRGCPNF